MHSVHPRIWAKLLADPSCRTFRRIEVQGDLLEYGVSHHSIVPVSTKPRGIIKEFSRATRLRMLKFIATIDWSRITSGHFMTFTYPDAVAHRPLVERKKDLSLLLRWMEKDRGRLLSGLYRWEWMPRQTGTLIGQHCPHMHLIFFDLPFFPYAKIHDWWRRRLGVSEPIHFDGKLLKEAEMAGMYVCKYVGKVSDPYRLVNDASCNIRGKQWGLVRKAGIPRHRRFLATGLTQRQWEALEEYAYGCMETVDPNREAGFSLLGDRCKLGLEILRSLGLTTREVER